MDERIPIPAGIAALMHLWMPEEKKLLREEKSVSKAPG